MIEFLFDETAHLDLDSNTFGGDYVRILPLVRLANAGVLWVCLKCKRQVQGGIHCPYCGSDFKVYEALVIRSINTAEPCDPFLHGYRVRKCA